MHFELLFLRLIFRYLVVLCAAMACDQPSRVRELLPLAPAGGWLRSVLRILRVSSTFRSVFTLNVFSLLCFKMCWIDVPFLAKPSTCIILCYSDDASKPITEEAVRGWDHMKGYMLRPTDDGTGTDVHMIFDVSAATMQ